MKMKTFVVFVSTALMTMTTLHAVSIAFDLQGQAGFGLLSGNETGAISGVPGTGGETGAGITFDDVTKQLSINYGWGSGNGFTDLTGTATASHIHGPTASPAPASFTQSTGVLIGLNTLAGWNSSASAGGFSGVVTIPDVNVADLMAGKLYINVHTATNGGGEIRGNLVPVPEPSLYATLLGAVAMGLILVKRRRE